MQSKNIQSSDIHCKVATQGEVRRFVTRSKEFNNLSDQIVKLFGFSKDSAVSIKYEDADGDLITVSSDQEFELAVLQSTGVLRLHIEQSVAEQKVDVRDDNLQKTEHPAPLVNPLVEVKPLEPPQVEQPMRDESDGNSAKWQQQNAKLLENPLLLQEKLGRLKEKQNKLQRKLGYFEDGQTCRSRPQQEKIRGRMAFISSSIASLSEQAALLPNSPSEQVCSSPVVPAVTILPEVPATITSASPISLSSSPNQEELLAERETLQPIIAALRRDLDQANMELKQRRANFKAEYSKGGETAELVESLRTEVAAAKQIQSARNSELQSHLARLKELRQQLKVVKLQQAKTVEALEPEDNEEETESEKPKKPENSERRRNRGRHCAGGPKRSH